jgi:hypothetical protein
MSVKEFDLCKLDTSMKSDDTESIFLKSTSSTTGKIQLKDITFIIPVRIDSNDRLENFNAVYNYLSKNFDTNIIVYESDSYSKLKNIVKNDVTFIYEKNESEVFHRTKYLNYMLNMVTTTITANYDVDIILPIESYIKARDHIVNDEIELLYPYQKGAFQHKINNNGRVKLLETNSIESLNNDDFTQKNVSSECGHCQFFNTTSYKKYGWENENFISYGPEDYERYFRFNKFKRKIIYMSGCYVYHMEHYRGNNSTKGNPHFNDNENLYNTIKNMTETELIEYYNNVEYISKYRKVE